MVADEEELVGCDVAVGHQLPGWLGIAGFFGVIEQDRVALRVVGVPGAKGMLCDDAAVLGGVVLRGKCNDM